MSSLVNTTLELGLVSSFAVLALFLSYFMLNVCDLSTDGCFTLGAVVSALFILRGHPFLALFMSILAGMISGLTTSFLQTKLGIDSLLSGIIVDTALYSVNIALMDGSSLLNLNKTETVFTFFKKILEGSFLSSSYKLITLLLLLSCAGVFLVVFLKTRLGLAIRASGDNRKMVESSSIDPQKMTFVGLCLSGGLTALSGGLLAALQKSVNIDIGSGMLTIALASLLIGNTIRLSDRISVRVLLSVLGALIFRFIYTLALRFDLPAYMLKMISALIVMIALCMPYLKNRYEFMKRKKAAGC